MRRYSIAGILGISPDDDIDSNEKLVKEVVSTNTKKGIRVKMTDDNYDEVKERCLKQWKANKTWAEIRLMVDKEYIIDKQLIEKLQKDITNAK